MAISFPCPACGKQHNVRDELAGKEAKCRCGKTLHVPASAAETEAGATAGGPSLADWFDEELSQPLPPAKAPAQPKPPDELELAPTEPVAFDPTRSLADRAVAEVDAREEEFRRDRAEFASTVAFRVVLLLFAPAIILGVSVLIGYFLPQWHILLLGLLVLDLIAVVVFAFFFIRVAVAAFFESILHGLAFLFLGPYFLYYLASRWDETEGPEAFVGAYLVPFLVFGLVIGMGLRESSPRQEVARSTSVASSADDDEPTSPDEPDDELQLDAAESGEPPSGEAVTSEQPAAAGPPEAAGASGIATPPSTEPEPPPEVALSVQLEVAPADSVPRVRMGPGQFTPMAPPGMPPAGPQGLVVTGRTSLPAGTVLKMEMKSALPGVVSSTASAHVGPDGSFSSQPIASALVAGRFHVDLWVDLVDQPSGVLATIGGQGEKLHGELVRAGQQKVVQYEATVDLGGQQAAEAQLREAAEAVRRCDVAMRQIASALGRIQDTRPRLRTFVQREGFQSQIVSQAKEIERDLSGLPDWSPKGLLLQAAGSLQVGSETSAASLDGRVEELLAEAKDALEPLRQLTGEPGQAAPEAAASAPASEPADAEREKAAAAQLQLGKMLIEANPSAARRRLEEVIEQFPGTKAAESAQQALEELEEE